MFIIKLIRRFFSLLRSNLTSHEIALGFCMGLLLGCLPFSSIWAVATVLLITLLLRASFSSFIAAVVVVKALSFLIAPILFALGEFALEGPPAGLFAAAVKQPVLALLDLHRYVVAGSLFFAVICSAVLYPLIYFLSQKYRKAIIKWSETSQRFARFTRFPLIRFLTWLFMGKKKGDFKETLALKKNPIRKGALILLLVFGLVLCLFLTFFGDPIAKAGLETGVAQVTDSKVEVRQLALDFLDGSLGLEDFYVYERDEEKGILRAVSLKGDLSVTALLKRHLVFDEIAIQNMDFRVARDEHGNLNLGRSKVKPDRESPPDAGMLEGAKSLSDLWQKKGLAHDILNHLLDYLFSEKTTDPAERIEEIKRDCERLKNYAAYFADFLLEGNQPLLVINNLKINGLKLKMEDATEKGTSQVFSDLSLHATALSSNPRLFGKDSLIEVGDDLLNEGSFFLKFTFNWSSPEPVHRLELRFRDLSSEVVMQYIKPGNDLSFSGGTVGLTADVALRIHALESKCRFRLQGVNVSLSTPGKKILGFDGELFCRGITEFLKDAPLETEVTITGPYNNLAIDVDDKGLIDSVK
ncbi:MAG: TIGR03546 family protein, partial [Planctomycetota bacterium]